MNRRKFNTSLAIILGSSIFPFTAGYSKNRNKRLNILVFGGTRFVGPAIVNSLKADGHNITLFNRGITNPSIFPDLKLIKGDRTLGDRGYKSLLNTKWDWVVDVWPEKSYMVEDAVKLFSDKTKNYLFISSIAVYDNFQTPGLNEESKVFEPQKDKSKWQYFEEKVHAERIVKKHFTSNNIILRPGPIKGWRDPATDMDYWLERIKENKEVLAPDDGNDYVQFIDVKDLADFATLCIAQGSAGTFNVTGPKNRMTWKNFLEQLKDLVNPKVKLKWASKEFLHANGVNSMSDLPLWAPLSEAPGFMQISNEKAVKKGLQFRPLKKTVSDILESQAKKFTKESKVGLSKETEDELLSKL